MQSDGILNPWGNSVGQETAEIATSPERRGRARTPSALPRRGEQPRPGVQSSRQRGADAQLRRRPDSNDARCRGRARRRPRRRPVTTRLASPLRLSDGSKEDIENLATDVGSSVNSWIVRTLERSVRVDPTDFSPRNPRQLRGKGRA